MNLELLENEIYYKKHSSWRNFLALLIPTIIAVVLFLIIISQRYFKRIEMYGETKGQSLEYGVINSTKNLNSFADFVFNSVVNTSEITELIYTAWNTPPDQRDQYRTKLYEILKEEYDNLRTFSFNQIHFHFPDTTSFLRMSDPTKYGDILRQSRPSIRVVNQKQEPMSGFGEGITFIGYRFLYPLYHNTIHCGSVEIAFSVRLLLKYINDIDNEAIQFIIKKELVEELYPDIAQSDFVLSKVSNNYLNHKAITSFGYTFEPTAQEKSKINSKLLAEKRFAFTTQNNGKSYILLFMPIQNFENKNIGWIVQFVQDGGKNRIRKDYILLASIALLLSIFAELVIILILSDRERLKKLSAFDMLTGIANRQQLYHLTIKEVDKALRYGYPISIILFDIDHFKSFNDTYGHAEGDRILTEIARIVSSTIRSSDIFGRWGGEEFILVVPHNTLEDAKKLAEKLRINIARTVLNPDSQVTISAGVTSYILDDTIEAMFNRADIAMYKAKSKGRNCVCTK